MKKVYLENLFKKENILDNKGKKIVDWKNSIGKIIKFTYENIEDKVKIVGYDKKNHMLYIKYQDKEPFEISTSNFKDCKLGKLLGKITDEFKIEIGVTFKDDKRDITIIDRSYIKDKNGRERKYYKYKCNRCGFECGEHYKNGEYKEELWILESSLKNSGCACCCCEPSQVVVRGINDIPTTASWMIPYFQGGYNEAKKYNKSSGLKIYPICPDCNRVKDKKINISNIYQNHSIGCSCGDGMSYPEKIIYNIFEQLKIDFISQLSKKDFKWCDKYRYDFYFKINNEKHIIEANGLQHYKELRRKKSKTLEEEQENDRLKKELALRNNIKEENYIVIDCRYSELDWIKNNENGILNSKLAELFDLSQINWLKCEEFACSSLIKKACEIKRDNPNMTTTQIGEVMKLNRHTIKNYLKEGTQIWDWCNYDPKEEVKRIVSKNGKLNKKSVGIFKDGIKLDEFESLIDLEQQSEEKFGVKLDHSNISSVCNNKLKQYKGFTFQYIESNVKTTDNY